MITRGVFIKKKPTTPTLYGLEARYTPPLRLHAAALFELEKKKSRNPISITNPQR